MRMLIAAPNWPIANRGSKNCARGGTRVYSFFLFSSLPHTSAYYFILIRQFL